MAHALPILHGRQIGLLNFQKKSVFSITSKKKTKKVSDTQVATQESFSLACDAMSEKKVVKGNRFVLV